MSSKNENIKVLGAGSPVLDILVNVEDSFIDGIKGKKGGMVLASSQELEEILSKTGSTVNLVPGGSAGNTIFGLAELGMDVSFLGKVGQDDDGAFYMDSLKKLGGDVSAFSFSSGAHTGRCLSLITPDSERTMRTDLGAAAELSGEDVTADKFNGITHVHVEGYMLFNEELFRGVVALAKEKNCTVSVDLASFEVVKAKKDVLPELLEKYVDIVFANEDEAAEFSNGGTPEKWLDCLSRFCRTAAVKLGGKGSIIKNSGEVVSVKAETVKAVDTTGAGDLWQTGFLYGFLNGKDLETCGRYGSILGAEVVKVIGADIPEERWREIDVRVKL